MNVRAIMAALKTGRLTGPIAACAVGAAAMLFPGTMIKWLFAGIGLCVGAVAVIKLISALIAGSLGLGSSGEIIGSIFLMLCSVFLAVEAEGVSAAAAAAMGGLLVAAGIGNLINRLKLRSLGIYTGLALPATGIALGAVIVCCPILSLNAIGKLIGAATFAVGTSQLVRRIKTGIAEYKHCDYPGAIDCKYVEL